MSKKTILDKYPEDYYFYFDENDVLVAIPKRNVKKKS